MKRIGGVTTASAHQQAVLVILVTLIELLCLAAVIGTAVLLQIL